MMRETPYNWIQSAQSIIIFEFELDMIEHLKALEEYLINNHMQSTLEALRAQVLSKYPQAPSNQLVCIGQCSTVKKNQGKTLELSTKLSQKSFINKKRSQRVLECLLGKIAYSSNFLDDEDSQRKIRELSQNRLFQKIAKSSQQSQTLRSQNIHKQLMCEEILPSQQQKPIHQFDDELQLVQGPSQNNKHSQISQLNQVESNIISKIELDNSEMSIVSQPSFVLEELNRNQKVNDGYVDDGDEGYIQLQFNESQLLMGCSKLTLEYGYPQKAVKKNSKNKIITKQITCTKNKKNKKFPQGVKFPDSNDRLYPIQYNGFIYDVLKLKVLFDRQKTGLESSEEFNIVEGEILAGRYQIEKFLGNGVFAKVIKAIDIVKNEETCLKMILNNKDFLDQALDEIKLLQYINANLNPDQFNLLKFKGAFYYREHLFIETELLKENLFTAYRSNQNFFSIPVLKKIAQQILIAINALHSLHIIHADLKPENILIKSYDPIQIKVVDLGNSCFFHDHLGEYVQSRSYRSPQVVLGLPYDEKIDIWSVGCVLAELWTKNVLFLNNHIQGMLAKIQGIVGPWPEWMLDEGQLVSNYFSKQNFIFFEQNSIFHILIPKQTSLKARVRTDDDLFLSFLEGILKIDPNFRLSAEDALEHPWLK